MNLPDLKAPFPWFGGKSRVAWKTKGGYSGQGHGRGRDNATRERIWFSPACLKPAETEGQISCL